MDQEGIKARMAERLEEVRLPMTELAEKTGDSYRNVQNWVKKDTTVPADFVARYIMAVPVNPEWLLSGMGQHAPPEEGVGERLHSLVDRLVRSKLSAEEKRDLLREFERLLSVVEGPDG